LNLRVDSIKINRKDTILYLEGYYGHHNIKCEVYTYAGKQTEFEAGHLAGTLEPDTTFAIQIPFHRGDNLYFATKESHFTTPFWNLNRLLTLTTCDQFFISDLSKVDTTTNYRGSFMKVNSNGHQVSEMSLAYLRAAQGILAKSESVQDNPLKVKSYTVTIIKSYGKPQTFQSCGSARLTLDIKREFKKLKKGYRVNIENIIAKDSEGKLHLCGAVYLKVK